MFDGTRRRASGSGRGRLTAGRRPRPRLALVAAVAIAGSAFTATPASAEPVVYPGLVTQTTSGTTFALWKTDTAASAPTQIPNSTSGESPSLAPDGKQIAFINDTGGS